MKKPNYSFGDFTSAVVRWLNTVYLDGSGNLSSAERLLQKFLKVLRTRGKKEAIRFCKERRASVYQWLATIGTPGVDVGATRKGGLPKDLRYLQRIQPSKFYPSLRLALTSLSASRSLELPVVPNVESITTPSEARLEGLGKNVWYFWWALGLRHQRGVPRRVAWKKFHLTTKQGPNGHASWKALSDLRSLPEDLLESIKFIGGKKLASRMDTLRRFGHLIPALPQELGRYRKISAIPDLEGKTREVAILDYWSQTSLRPLHEYLFSYLRRIPQDCTFDQGSFITKLDWSEGTFYSIDMTSATDRMPIALIEMVLKGRFTDDYVRHWRNIMVGYPFWTPDGLISYAVGNPMGAYSSWNSFALTHHYIVFHCCKELGMDWSSAPYVLLGDDIVIKGDALAQKYIEVLNQLDVKFSIAKTHISPHMYEFAKRVVHHGVEVTPYPISALWSSRTQPAMMLPVILAEERRGWITSNGTPSALVELLAYLKYPRRRRAQLEPRLFVAYQMMVALSGRITAREAIEPIVVRFYPNISDRLAKAHEAYLAYDNILKETVCRVFSESADPGKGGKPLGVIAEDLVLAITGVTEADFDPSDFIAAVPTLQIHGQVEERWLEVMKEARTIDTLLKGDWKLTLKALTIPSSDSVYYLRNQDIKIRASLTFGKVLRENLDGLQMYPQLI